MKIGIIREGKSPSDSRVPLTPAHCAALNRQPGESVVAQPSPTRCYPDTEYAIAGIPLQEDLSDCDLLLGVKEVPVDQLIPEKTYCFFSHTIKEQPYNRGLLRAVLAKKIRLIDYEVITDDQGRRLIAFGRFAGMVGAYNGLWTYGQRTGLFHLQRMYHCRDYAEARRQYDYLRLPPIKIVLTGTGRVGNGAKEVLMDLGIREVSPEDFLSQTWEEAVFTQLECNHYAERTDGRAFDMKDFFKNPQAYQSKFAPFYRMADLLINGIFWDNRAPAFFTKAEMRRPDFRIRVIADVTCDIAPVASIPSTLRATTITDPVFGYDPVQENETAPYQKHVIDMMTIDNLPNELPRDASTSFGEAFLDKVWPEFQKDRSAVLERATIAEAGLLGKHFQYLKNYVGV